MKRLKALSNFTKIINASRGNPTPEQAKAFLDAGYTEKQILAIILAPAVKTIINYSNHFFIPRLMKPLVDENFKIYKPFNSKEVGRLPSSI